MIAFWIRALVDEGAVVVAAAGQQRRVPEEVPGGDARSRSRSARSGRADPSSFSNHGPVGRGVRARRRPVSEFFDHFDGAYEAIVSGIVPDIDEFAGWAMWSGTSFSTPTVVGALAETRSSCTTATRSEAVDMLIRRPGLFRIPDYGVVVNRIF